jgi:hypothetical protein
MPHAYLTPRPIFPRPFDRRQADTVENVRRDAGKIARATGLSQDTARQLAERIHFTSDRAELD